MEVSQIMSAGRREITAVRAEVRELAMRRVGFASDEVARDPGVTTSCTDRLGASDKLGEISQTIVDSWPE